MILYQIYKRLHAHDFFCVFFMNYFNKIESSNTLSVFMRLIKMSFMNLHL